MSGRFAEAWDRVVASDPGLTRLRMAGSAAVCMASALALEYGFATLMGVGKMGTIISMLLGAVMSMMGSMALNGHEVWPKVRTAAFFPVAIGTGMLAGTAVSGNTDLMLSVFVLVMFAAVMVRRFGMAFFFYGFMGWMGYFFSSFLHATMAMLPQLLLAVVVATAWILLLSSTILRTNARRTLRRTVRAFSARARAVNRTCADLLAAAETHPGRGRSHRRLRARQARLAEAALMVEAWSAEQGALPPEESAPVLRRRLIDAQQVLDRMAAASVQLAQSDPALARAAADTADRLARRDDVGARSSAYALTEIAERSARAPVSDRLEGWLSARHFAEAALEFVALAHEANSDTGKTGDDLVDEFEPVVQLAMGNLPGSPAVARNVSARGRGWNPLARLDMTTRQAIQVALAGGLAIVLGRELSEARYYWAVIAAFIMFSGTSTRAETFLKGFNRVLGTLVGLFASVGFAQLTAGNTVLMLTVIVASMFCGFYLIRISYAYMIFFVTIMVGQLYSVLNEFSSQLLVLRLEETALGALVGFVVALVVTPLSTRDTVRSARDTVLDALANLLDAAADRLNGSTESGSQDLEALSRALDDGLRQLAVVAKPLTRPLLWGNSPLRTRHRLALYGATNPHARALAVALRNPPPGSNSELVTACQGLAAAARRLTEAKPGRKQPAVAEPLGQAEAALFSHAPAAPGTRATDPIAQALLHLEKLLHELAALPATRAQPPENASTELVGTINDASGEPIHGRVVLINEATQQRQSTAYSDAGGRYRVDDCPVGQYLAVASAAGHQPVAHRVVLQAGRTVPADFTLTQAQPRTPAPRAATAAHKHPRRTA